MYEKYHNHNYQIYTIILALLLHAVVWMKYSRYDKIPTMQLIIH